jgi:hypothetical protein
MAFLMTDVAAGSQAALQLQQNMAAAPYVEQNAKADAEEKQLKLQQDRLKTQYAPQAMALEMQQTAANNKRLEIQNLLNQQQLDFNTQEKADIEELKKSPGFNEKSTSEQLSAIAGKVALRGDYEKASKVYKAISDAEYKEALAQDKRANEDFRTLATARTALQTGGVKNIEKTFNNLPESSQQAVFDRVGKENWNNYTPEQKLETLDGLMYSTSQQLQLQKMQSAERIKQMTLDNQAYLKKLDFQFKSELKMMGVSDKREDKLRDESVKAWDVRANKVEGEFKTRLDKAETLLQEGELELQTGILQTKANFREKDPREITGQSKVDVATKQIQQLTAKRNAELLQAAKQLPAGPYRDAVIDSLTPIVQPSPPASDTGDKSKGDAETVNKSVEVPGSGPSGGKVAAPGKSTMMPPKGGATSNKDSVPGLLDKGNIDLNKRPVVKNKDGSISTVRSMSFEEDGKEVLIPTVVGNKVVSDKEAIAYYRKTGEHLGKFDSPKAADVYAKTLHEQQGDKYMGTKAAPMSMPKSAADAVDGKYYTLANGAVAKWDAKKQKFVAE